MNPCQRVIRLPVPPGRSIRQGRGFAPNGHPKELNSCGESFPQGCDIRHPVEEKFPIQNHPGYLWLHCRIITCGEQIHGILRGRCTINRDTCRTSPHSALSPSPESSPERGIFTVADRRLSSFPSQLTMEIRMLIYRYTIQRVTI
jgi:hypothetical protein